MWNMVMDPRFAQCEKAWYRKTKITASQHGVQETGLLVVADDGTLTSSRLISIEQYAEIIGEGRHYAEAVDSIGDDPRRVKDLSDEDLIKILMRESPNYFDKKGKPNKLAEAWVDMFKADVLGLVLDYASEANVSQWVFVDTGDVAHDTSLAAAEKNPIAQAEIEYMDRALMYRAVLRANAIKVICKLGGSKLEAAIEGLVFTEFEKDMILQTVFQYPFDQLYKALNVVLGLVEVAKKYPFEVREARQLGMAVEAAQEHAKALREGRLKPIDLMDGDHAKVSEEAQRFAKIRHDENLTAAFYMLIQAEEIVSEYPKMQAVIDILLPIMEKAEAIPQDDFEALCEQIQTMTDEATSDPEVCQERVSDVE
jgi:hypothetical protein